MATTPTSITRIDPSEYVDKGVIGLPDAPELSALEMQEKFDEIAIEVIIPHINGMAGEIETVVDEVKTSVAAEETRAKSVEQALSTMIGAEITRATNAEQDISDNLSAEIARSVNEDTNLSNQIIAETERAQNAENALSSRITEVVTQKIDALGLSVVDGQLCATYNI